MLTMARSPLGNQAEKVLNGLIACGPGWHSRNAIASQLQKKRLNPAEVLALDYLVESGRVESERHEVDGPMPLIWFFRPKEGTD